MDRQTSLVEWVIAERDEQWERLSTPSCPDNLPGAAPAPPDRRPIQRILAGVTVLLLLLLGAGDWWWRTTLAVSQQREADWRATAAHEVAAVAESETRLTATSGADQSGLDGWYRRGRGQNGLSAAVQTANPTAHPNVDIDVSQLQEDGSLARVVVTARNGEVTKRQTRFYRQTATGWELTTPDPEF